MIKDIIEMLRLSEWYGESDTIEIAKGKYKQNFKIKDVWKQKKRELYIKKNHNLAIGDKTAEVRVISSYKKMLAKYRRAHSNVASAQKYVQAQLLRRARFSRRPEGLFLLGTPLGPANYIREPLFRVPDRGRMAFVDRFEFERG